MRTRRLKITRKNYEGLKRVANSIPKHSKGNGSVREALNISSGNWSYLCNSKDYDDFVRIGREKYLTAAQPVEAPKPVIEQQTMLPKAEYKVIEKEPKNELVEELRAMNRNIVRLCLAWESAPSKKGWLK